MRHLAALFFTLAMALTPLFGSAPAWSAGASGRSVLSSEQVFQQARASVVEVRQQSTLSIGEISTASGFAVGSQGFIATNYHAVSDAVLEPLEVEVIIVGANGERIRAKVSSVDVINDLALLKPEKPFNAQPLRLNEDIPEKGARGFAMGNPGGFGVSIVEGSFNGLFENTDISNIHFTGAINGGMSGGPAFDNRGAVVGVNVATSRDDQLVAYLVPAAPLAWLIEFTEAQGPLDNAGLRELMALQVGMLTDTQLENIELAGPGDGKPDTQQLGPFTVMGKLHPDKECSAGREQDQGVLFSVVTQICRASDSVYISDEVQVGHILAAHFLLADPGMTRTQIARMQEHVLAELRDSAGVSGDSYGEWTCERRRLRASNTLPLEMYACRRAILDLSGLYDFRFRAASLVNGRAGLVAALGATGFDQASANKLLKAWLGVMDFDPGQGVQR